MPKISAVGSDALMQKFHNKNRAAVLDYGYVLDLVLVRARPATLVQRTYASTVVRCAPPLLHCVQRALTLSLNPSLSRYS